MRHLIRKYTVWELIYQIWDRVDQNKKEEEENGCVQAMHSFVTDYVYNHFYSLAVEAGFYGDTGRAIGFFMKLSNGDRG